MTKDEWLISSDIHNMLTFAKPSERKIRLFAIACYKHVFKPSDLCRLAESYVDGKTHKNTLHTYYRQHDTFLGRQQPDFCLIFTYTSLDRVIKIVSHGTRLMARGKDQRRLKDQRKWQANLLRHMVKIHD